MSHNALEADTFTAAIPITDVDDTTYPDTEANMGVGLANRTRYLYNSIIWGFTGGADTATFDTETEELLTAIPHPYTRLGALNFFSQIAKPVVGTVKYLSERIPGLSASTKKTFVGLSGIGHQFSFFEQGGIAILGQGDVSGDEVWHVEIPVPIGGFLRNVTVWGLPLTGITHSALPVTKPTITVYTVESQVPGLTGTSLGSATDPSASTGAYDVLHSISLDLSRAMTQTLSTGALLGYRLKITGEASTNAIAQGFAIAAITASFSRGASG